MTYTYTYECFKCGKKKKVKTSVMWDDRSRLLPKGWIYRVENGFCHTLCPSCK